MPVLRFATAASTFFLIVALGLPARAAEAAVSRPCLSKAEQRAAVAADEAVPLAHAIKSLRGAGRRAEVVRARLCHSGEGLVYVLTLLARSGKVTRATIDATNGELIN